MDVLPSSLLFASQIWSLSSFFPELGSDYSRQQQRLECPQTLISEEVAKPLLQAKSCGDLSSAIVAPQSLRWDLGAYLFSCRASCLPLRPSEGELAGEESLLR